MIALKSSPLVQSRPRRSRFWAAATSAFVSTACFAFSLSAEQVGSGWITRHEKAAPPARVKPQAKSIPSGPANTKAATVPAPAQLPPGIDVQVMASTPPVPQPPVPQSPASPVTMPTPMPQSAPGAAPNQPERPSLVETYCTNIADAARDARYGQQRQQLELLEAELQQRMDALDQKIAAYQSWVARRNAFIEKARDTLVRVFATMKPEAAARQLAEVEEETAAAILSKLVPRTASAILGDMEPSRAARLAQVMASAARPGEGKSQ